jgi:hypothetical protein
MKKIVLFLTLFFTVAAVSAQSFMHGAGVTVFAASSPGSKTTVGYGLTYSPRFNFLETESLSVSVGIPLSVGISFSASLYSPTSTYDDDVSLGVVLHAPLIVNLNMGRGSTKDNTQKFGFFVGAGASYYHGDFIDSYSYGDGYSINAFGPAGNAGVRLGVGRKHRNIEIRFSYMKGINDNIRTRDDGFGNPIKFNDKPNVYGVACLFNF